MAETARRARVERLLQAARELAHPATAAGRALRARLLETTQLSPQNIERGLTRCLETSPEERHLGELLASTPSAPRAHVLLSSNVFVAALRAIAIGLASSEQVAVRASRRDPALAEALHQLDPELFALTTTLSPASGEHYWAYGSDATLHDLRAKLPAGLWFHGHGAGLGAVVVDAEHFTPDTAHAIALDTALFDQHGCLSPRVVSVLGDEARAKAVAEAIARELTALERELPPGPQTNEELAEMRQQRDSAAYAFELFQAGAGWVSASPELVVPPARRCLHVAWTSDPRRALTPLTQHLTCIANATRLGHHQLQTAFPGARIVAPGDMQRPTLDGPVDRRHGSLGVQLPA